MDKIHEEAFTNLLVDTLKNAKGFIDCGTHIGYFTMIGAFCLRKDDRKVYGFDLDPQAIEKVERNVKLNRFSNVEVYNFAITDKKGKVNFVNMKTPYGGKKIIKSKENTVEVSSISLDDFFGKTKIVPDVVKLDIEGAEILALKGMVNMMLSQDMHIFMEIQPTLWSSFNTNQTQLFELIKKTGYVVEELIDHRYTKRVKLEKVNKSTTFNRFDHMIYIHK